VSEESKMIEEKYDLAASIASARGKEVSRLLTKLEEVTAGRNKAEKVIERVRALTDALEAEGMRVAHEIRNALDGGNEERDRAGTVTARVRTMVEEAAGEELHGDSDEGQFAVREFARQIRTVLEEESP
jgi:hypothetical protein